MAEVQQAIRVGDTWTNLIDSNNRESVNYRTVETWYDGSPMTDLKCDNFMYRKVEGRYEKRVNHINDLSYMGVFTKTYINIWEYSFLCTDRIDPNDPDTWDWTEALRAAFTVGGENGTVILPSGRYRVTDNIRLRGNIVGQKSIIYADSTFSPTLTGYPYYGAMLYCDGGDNRTSHSITGITLEYSHSITCYQLNMRRVDDVTISNCKFIADEPNEAVVVNINLLDRCSNIKILNNYLSATTLAPSDPGGGNIWVRNVVSNEISDLPTALTENVLIQGNTIVKDSWDESVAVFGNNGKIRNVKVIDNDITQGKTISTGTVFSVFPYSTNGTFPNASVDTCTVRNNTFNIYNVRDNIFRVGAPDDGANVCDKIDFIENKIHVYNASSSSYIIRREASINNIFNIYGNIIVSDVPMAGGILSGRKICGNSINGNFSEGSILGGTLVSGNQITGSRGIGNALNVIDNILNVSVSGVRLQSTNTSIVKGNRITLTGSTAKGFIIQSLNSSTPNMHVIENFITTSDIGQVILERISGGYYYITGNTISGEQVTNIASGAVTNTNILKMSDNTWYGVNDTLGNFTSIPMQVRNLMPVGTVIWRTDAYMDGSNVIPARIQTSSVGWKIISIPTIN